MKTVTIVVTLLVLLTACKAKESSGVQKIKSGSREVAQGVKEEAKKLSTKVESEGKKIKRDVKTNTHH